MKLIGQIGSQSADMAKMATVKNRNNLCDLDFLPGFGVPHIIPSWVVFQAGKLFFGHSPELGSLLYSLYKIPLFSTRPDKFSLALASGWWAGEC